MKNKKILFANSKSGGGILDNKAFTLIELLAIIVILAIIAVITVPIILNIIENSRKGTSIDSAYGFKDSVQKYYLTKSISDDTIDPVYGIETVKTVEQLETDGLTVSGDKPTEGWVQLNKGQVVDYSLKFGDYVVSFDSSTNTPVSTKNGELKAQPSSIPTMAEMCPGCVYGKASATIGDSAPTGISNSYTSLGNYFLGYIVEGGNVTRGFACGIENGTPFCLEGYDESKYSDVDSDVDNVGVLNTIFPSCNASASDTYADCNGSSVSGSANDDGGVFVVDGNGYCGVSNGGSLYCDE